MITLFFLFNNMEVAAGITSLSDPKPISDIRFTLTSEVKRVDAWNGIDKLKHFSVSLILTTSSYYYMKKPFSFSNNASLSVSIPFSFLIGLGKEFRDSKEDGNHFSLKDLTVDVLGIASGWIIANNLR